MKTTCWLPVVLFALWTLAPAHAEEGFKPLFDGKSLAGWEGDPALWKVQEGVIVGSTDTHRIRRNTFLSTDKTYANFVLRLKFKLRNGNSGVQFRSKRTNGYGVAGYQADIADNQFMGILYDEGGTRGILKNVKEDEVKKHVDPQGWNEYVITADGPHITQAINGFQTVDYLEKNEDAPREGIIALQLHVGPDMQVMFKDIEIKELP
jgi:hypothetical protein